jgi:hypothetical protein
MKNLMSTNRGFIKALVALVLIGGISSSWSMPIIEKEDSSAGRVDSVRVEKSSVEGRIWRVTPYHTTLGAHVHVSLVDSKGKIIAQGMDRLPVMLPKDDSTRKYSSYKVTFNEEISRSHVIRVKYVPFSHSQCESHKS